MHTPPSTLAIVSRAARLDRAVRLVWQSAPGWTLAHGALMLLQGALPPAMLVAVQRLVDAVTVAVRAYATPDVPVAVGATPGMADLWFWVAVAGGLALALTAGRALAAWVAEAHAQTVTDALSDRLHAQSAALDLGYYEDARFHDTLHRAQQEALTRPLSIVENLIQAGQHGIALIGIAGVLAANHWPAALALAGALAPAVWLRLRQARRHHAREQSLTETERRAWYYHWLLTDATPAPEMRLYELGETFRERFRALRRTLRDARIGQARERAGLEALAESAAALALYGVLAWLAVRAVRGACSLGSLVMYFQGFQQALGLAQALFHDIGALYEDQLFLEHWDRFFALQPAIRAPAHPRPFPDDWGEGLALRDVHFTYPGAAAPALAGVSLALPPGRMLALVGENGAGKTTLAKLLARLYDPTAGHITVGGADLRDLDPLAWRRQIAVIGQQYMHYALTAAENIALGDVVAPVTRERMEDAARRAGAAELIRRLPRGYDTPLSAEFEGGRELSVGEWQKIALARALLRDARLIVLDEPTSALDPLAETALFRQLRESARGRTILLISHRFSTVRFADIIAVLGEGRLIEHGTHAELMRQAGAYARLYRAQNEAPAAQ